MPDIYKIQLEPLKNADVDNDVKKLSVQLAKTNNVIIALKKALEKSASLQKEAEKKGISDPRAIRATINASTAIEKHMMRLFELLSKFTKIIHDLPKEIQSAVESARKTGYEIEYKAAELPPHVTNFNKKVIKDLTKASRDLSKAAPYKEQQANIRQAINVLIKELSSARTDVETVVSAVKQLVISIGKSALLKPGEQQNIYSKPYDKDALSNNLTKLIKTAVNDIAKVAETSSELSSSLKDTSNDVKSLNENVKDTADKLKETSKHIDEAGNKIKDTANKLKEVDDNVKETSDNIKRASDNIKESGNKVKDTADAIDKVSSKLKDAADTSRSIPEDFSNLSDSVKKASKEIAKHAIEVKSLPDLRSAIATRVYTPTIIGPSKTEGPYPVKGEAASQVDKKTLAIWGQISKSLYDLQKNIVKSVEEGIKGKGIQIWESKKGQPFQLGQGGRQWELRLADVKGLRRELKNVIPDEVLANAGVDQLVKAYKDAFVRRKLAAPIDTQAMAAEVYKEIGSLSSESVNQFGKEVKKLFEDIRSKKITEKELESRADLNELYKNVALQAKANRDLMDRFVKVLAIPAAKVTAQGTTSFETKYGSEKALANFATITTGLERMVNELQSLGASSMELARRKAEVSRLPLRPRPGSPEWEESNKLARELRNEILRLGGRDLLKIGYSRAVRLRMVERGATPEEALKQVQGIGLSELIKKSKELNISALDVAHALDQIKFENFYDILNKLFNKGQSPLLQKHLSNVWRLDKSERSFRRIASIINDVLGLMPTVPPGKPKRREYESQVVRVLTKPTEELKPEEAKKRIIDINLLWKDLVDRSKKLNEELFVGKRELGRPIASSLDLSDAASSSLKQFGSDVDDMDLALKQFNLDFDNNLRHLDKTMTSMSLENLRGVAPFKQFSSIQRQMSYASSALSGGLPGGIPFQRPSLISEKERKLIESGKYGTEGYGLNVLTELRNTAGTFEDQIEISGRLAKAFTKITKTLIQPGATLLNQKAISEVQGGIKRMTPRAARMLTESEKEFKTVLSQVVSKFQDILGVPEKYRGRADIAEISKNVESIIREHRGKNIEVQAAKLTEMFLNYFGRKLSTRFGTKGVAITPKYGELPKEVSSLEDVARFIKQGFKAGVVAGPGLGVAKMPKSAGQMISEILEKELGGLHTSKAGVELHNKLVASGNKFIIDLFKDASKGLVTSEEAKAQSDLFKKVSKLWYELFKAELPTGAEGIKEIRELYTEMTGKKPYEFKPIEARISSRGIAKRGLMPEVLEAILNNLIGSTAGTTTLVDNIAKGALTETKEARKKLNEYLKALGFESFKDLDKVISNLKLENPKLSDEDIEKLKKFESQWSVYTDVINEFGEKTQSLVAPKFLQIIEEPHLYKSWSSSDISKGIKGAKLDFQSFAAMMGVFGKGSSMMKELANYTTMEAKAGWELIKAFQMLDPAMKDVNKTIMANLPTVSLADLRSFEKATGTIEDFKDTIFDLGKYPSAFKLKVPSEKGKYENLYIPGAALRATYREQLLGELAPTNISRYLANLVNAAKEVEDLMAAASHGGVGLDEAAQEKFISTIRQELTKELTSAIKNFREIESSGTLTTQNIQNMQAIIDKFKAALSPTRQAPAVYQEVGATSELASVEAFAARTTGPHKYSTILSRIADLLIGANPQSINADINKLQAKIKIFKESGRLPKEYKGRPEDFEATMQHYINIAKQKAAAKSVFDIELKAGNLKQFAEKLGMDVTETLQAAISQKLADLSRAKIRYFEELGKEVFGKKKGIEQVFFQRSVPAITGKAVSAITDKTKELGDLVKTLTSMKYDLHLDMPGLDDLIKKVEKLSKEHSDYVKKAKTLGLPVLKEGEIAIPEREAAKIAVQSETGVATTLAGLIKKQGKAYVESIRYPFTGTLSIQPAQAKLMEQLGLKLGEHAIAVPGAPKLNLNELTRIITTLKEYIGIIPKEKRQYIPKETESLIEQREKAWSEGTEAGAKKAKELTATIEGLIKVINEATPKFGNLEQKLDFDGDALFVHTGRLKKSREEIAKHFKALSDDVTSVRTLFRSLFTAVKESDVSTLAEMANIFSKKHPTEKGFEFLTKPYITEQMKNLNMNEVMSSLFTYEKGAAQIKEKGPAEWNKAVENWSKSFMTNTILPEVFHRLSVGPEEQKAYLAKIEQSPSGILKPEELSNKLEQQISRLADELVRQRLWEKRYADAIAGQLYKLHTGQTVEGISRIVRVSELETGFGQGLAKTGKPVEPSQEFLKAFPKESIALGGRPAQEFASRVNEIMRFVIQKGMDVKHAGVEAVGKKIIANIGKANGAKIIMKAMEEAKDQFDELIDFNKQIENEVRLRLGRVSTPQLKQELKLFEPELDVSNLQMTREELIQAIIKHVNLEAVFEELFRQIRRQAIKGYVSQLQEKLTKLPPTQRLKLSKQIEAAGGLERFATEEITRAAKSPTGISLFKYITTNLQPLYRMRTKMETQRTAAARAGINIEPTTMPLPQGDVGKKLAEEFETAQKAAYTLSRALEKSSEISGRGIYTSMVQDAIKKRYQELDELEKLDEATKNYVDKFSYVFTGTENANKLAAKIWDESKKLAHVHIPDVKPTDIDLIDWLSDMYKIKKIASQKLESLVETAGLPPMPVEEQHLLFSKFEEKFGSNIFSDIKDILSRNIEAKGEKIIPSELEKQAQSIYDDVMDLLKFQVLFVEQLKRVEQIAKTAPIQKFHMKAMFPGIEFNKPQPSELTSTPIDKNIGSMWLKASKEAKGREQAVSELLQQYADAEIKSAVDNMKENMQAATTTSKSYTSTTATAENMAKEIADISDEAVQYISKDVVSRVRNALKYLESKSEGRKIGAVKKPLYEIYRASAIHAGGTYGGGNQVEAILKEMLGLNEPNMLLEATSFRGQAIHRKIQKEFLKKYPKAQIEQPIQDMENAITGHFDILYEKEGKKIVTDIKTVYSQKQFERIKEVAKEIKDRKITIQQKLKELKEREPTSEIEKNVIRRLEDYISQINVYLKNVEGAVGEVLIVNTLNPEERITIPIGKFDPNRFANDIKKINEARSKVYKIIESINETGGLPEDLLKDYPELYKELAKKLEELGPKKFIAQLPTHLVGERPVSSRSIIRRLNERQQAQFERLSKEYLDMFNALGGPGKYGAQKYYTLWFASGAKSAGAGGAAVPPGGGAGAPPGGGGAGVPPMGPTIPPTGGGPGDDNEEFIKRIKELLKKLKNVKEPDVADINQLVSALREAEDRAASALYNNTKADREVAAILSDLADKLRETIESSVGMKSAEKISELYKLLDQVKSTGRPTSTVDFSKFRTEDIERINPDRPEAIHKNLKALYEAAVRIHKLADPKEIEKYGEGIADILKDVAEKGPSPALSTKISQAIAKLPPEKKGAMERIWMHYKKAVSDYFLKQLDELKQEIEMEGGSAEGRKAYLKYEQVLERYLANIKGTLGRTSDIFTMRGPSGGKTQFVNSELARLVGIYKTPAQLIEHVKQSSLLSGQYKPILDVLIGDLQSLNPNEITKPIDKVRQAFELLTNEDKDLKKLLSDVELFKRLGPDAMKAWDFKSLAEGITQLRSALEAYDRLQIGGFGGLGEDYTEVARKNVKDTLKYLKQLERMFSSTGGASSPFGMVGVPNFLSPNEQKLLHRLNIAKIREAFKRPESEGGLPRGKGFIYRYKIIDPETKQVLENMAVEFTKLGEAVDSSGHKIGVFKEKWDDLIKLFQGRRTIREAFGRVLRWGFASRTVYGLVNALKNMVSTISDVEYGIAKLRQVMSPLDSDFNKLLNTALQFGKEFGLPIREVIDSMKVFAQQGLAQNKVLDMTRTSLLAANVSTLNAVDATEALTAATRIYGDSAKSTIRFLDAWSQVEAKHAITSKDLALGLQKAAAVAKTAGIDFDQLNAIITGIGETSRQTGKQIGTSLVFIFRRMHAKKGEKALAELGIPTINKQGDLRSAFNILGDLAEKWDELSNAQRLSVAQAIGGRRHYNNLIILMEHWSSVLDALQDSINSKGAAERRNAIVMETYAKKVQQVKAALVELQVQFGKFALPIAKVMLRGLKAVLETIANIPPSIKIASLAFAGFFALVSKGSGLVQSIVNEFVSFKSIVGDLTKSFSHELKKGIFETFGKLPKSFGNINTKGLSVVTQAGKKLSDFESVIGKLSFILVKFGRVWNDVLSEVSYKGSVVFSIIGKLFGGLAGFLSKVALSSSFGLSRLKGVFRVAAAGAKMATKGFDKLAEGFGISAESLAKWSIANSSFVKSVGPLAGSIAALIPVSDKIKDAFKALTYSADAYAKSLAPIKRHLSGQLEAVTDIVKGYNRIESTRSKIAKFSEPTKAKTAIRRNEYISPILLEAKNYKQMEEVGNKLAAVNNKLVIGFDRFGNAILDTTVNLKDYLKTLQSDITAQIAEKDVAALEKYVDSLTNASTVFEKFKSEFKKFIKEVPGAGPILSKFIKVSPAKELKDLVEILNKISTAKAQSPFGVAFDKLYNTYYKQLEEVRDKYNDFYESFVKGLSAINTKGLSKFKISQLFTRENLVKGYKLMVERSPRLSKLAEQGQLSWRDVMGSTILKKIHPEISFDFAAPLTKELFKQAGIIKRAGKAFNNDVVLFAKNLPDEFEVAGKQGVLKYNKKLKQFVVEVVDTFGSVKEIPFNEIKKFVDSIFPAHRIIDELEDNINILEEFLTGATAGMMGKTSREFKRSFNIGPRFFSQIPTTTLLQTNMGYNYITKQFGGEPFKRQIDFAKITKQYLDTFKELSMMTSESKKRLAAGKSLGIGPTEDIVNLQKLIRNNQIVIQYMALYSDLEKTLSETDRVLEENIKAERNRNKYLKETAGLLAGIPESFKNINLGIRNYFKLTNQQRLLFKEKFLPPNQRVFTHTVENISNLELKRKAYASELERISRAMVQLRFIYKQAKEQGNVLSKEDMSTFQTVIEKGLTLGQAQLYKEAAKTSSHTKTLVGQVSTIIDFLSKSTSPERLKYIANTIRQDIKNLKVAGSVYHAFGARPFEEEIKAGFDRLAKLREMNLEKGNVENVKAINKIMSDLSGQLIKAVGFNKAIEIFRSTGISPIKSPIDVATRLGLNIQRMATTNPFKMAAYTGLNYNLATMVGPENKYKSTFTQAEFLNKVLGPNAISRIVSEIEKAAASREAFATKSTLTANEHINKYFERVSAAEAIQSKTFKELKENMYKQVTPNVIGSKNIMKLLSGISAYEVVMRNAEDRVVRGIKSQRLELVKEQAELTKKYRAGKITKSEYQEKSKQIGGKLYELGHNLMLAKEDAKRRTAIAAISAMASASMAFARRSGVNEKLLKAFGGATASAIVAWRLWSKATGEKMPKVVEKASKSLDNFAKNIKGKSVGFWDKVLFKMGKVTGFGFGAAGKAGASMKEASKYFKSQKEILSKEEKDKIFKASKDISKIKENDLKTVPDDKKMLDINQKQLLMLEGIESNTRKMADVAKSGKSARSTKESDQESKYDIENLRKSLDDIKRKSLLEGGGPASKFKDIFAAFTLIASGGYLAEKTKVPAQIAQARKQADKVNRLFLKLSAKYPEVVNAAVRHLIETNKDIQEKLKKAVTPKEKEQLALEAEKSINVFFRRLGSLAEKAGQGIMDTGFKENIEKERASLQILIESFNNTIDQLGKSLYDSMVDLVTNAKLALKAFGPMKGILQGPEYNLTKTISELTPTQHMLRLGGKSWQNAYLVFQALQSYRQGIGESLKRASKSAYEERITYEKSNPIPRNELVNRLENVIKKIEAIKKGTLPIEKFTLLSNKEAFNSIIGEVKNSIMPLSLKTILGEQTQIPDQLKAKELEILRNKKSELENQIEKQQLSIKSLQEANNRVKDFSFLLDISSDKINKLSKVLFEVGVNVGSLVGSFEKLKHSFQMETQINAFNEAFNNIFKNRPGGPGPNAPVIPSLNLIRAGYSLNDLTISKQQAAIAEIIMSKGRAPTVAELQEIEYKKQRAIFEEKLNKAINEVERQQKFASSLFSDLIAMKGRLKGTLVPEGGAPTKSQQILFDMVDKVIEELKIQNKHAGELRRTGPNSYEFVGFNFKKIHDMLNGLLSKYGNVPEVKNILEESGIDISNFFDMIKSGFDRSPIVSQLSNINDILKNKHLKVLSDIEKNTRGLKSLSDKGYNPNDYDKEHNLFKPKKAIGGIISGPGGPKEDKVPIMASPGEFIIKADSVKKVGTKILEYINKTGKLPKFASGGKIPDITVGNLIAHKDETNGWILTNKNRLDSVLENKSMNMNIPNKLSKPIVIGDVIGYKDHNNQWVLTNKNIKPSNIHGVITAGTLSAFKDEKGQWVITDNPSKYMPKYANPVIKNINPSPEKMFEENTYEAPIAEAKAEKLSEYYRPPITGYIPNLPKALNKNYSDQYFKSQNKYSWRGGLLNLPSDILYYMSYVLDLPAEKLKEIRFKANKDITNPNSNLIALMAKSTGSGLAEAGLRVLSSLLKSGGAFLSLINPKVRSKIFKNIKKFIKEPHLLNRIYQTLRDTIFDAIYKIKSGDVTPGSEMLSSALFARLGKVIGRPGIIKKPASMLTKKPVSMFSKFTKRKIDRATIDELKNAVEYENLSTSIDSIELFKTAISKFSNNELKSFLSKYYPYIRKMHGLHGLLPKSFQDKLKYILNKYPTAIMPKNINELKKIFGIKHFKEGGKVVPQEGDKVVPQEGGKVVSYEKMSRMEKLDYMERRLDYITKKLGLDDEINEVKTSDSNNESISQRIGKKLSNAYDVVSDYFGKFKKYLPSKYSSRPTYRPKHNMADEQFINEFLQESKSSKNKQENKDKYSYGGLIYPLYYQEGGLVDMDHMSREEKLAHMEQTISRLSKELGNYDDVMIDKPVKKDSKSFFNRIKSFIDSGVYTAKSINDKLHRKPRYYMYRPHRNPKDDPFIDEIINDYESRHKKEDDEKEYNTGGLVTFNHYKVSRSGIDPMNIEKTIIQKLFGNKKYVDNNTDFAKYIIDMFIKRSGEKISAYEQGTPYVPNTQLAIVHKGEAIVPAKYNLGGLINAPAFAVGGSVNPLTIVENAGEKLGEAIIKKLEKAEIKLATTEVTAKLDNDTVSLDVSDMKNIVDELKTIKLDVNIPSSNDLPKLEIGNLEELKTILSNVSTKGIGAEKGDSKIDQFIELATNKFDRLEEQMIKFDDTVKIVNTAIKELDELKVESNDIKNKMYSKLDRVVDSNKDMSYVDSRLHEVISDLKNDELSVIESRLFTIETSLSELKYNIDVQADIMYSNINRLDLK